MFKIKLRKKNTAAFLPILEEIIFFCNFNSNSEIKRSKSSKSNDINISPLKSNIKSNGEYNSEKNNCAMYQRRELRITVGYQYTSLFTLGKHTTHRPLKWWFYISELFIEVKTQVSKTSITKKITIYRYCQKLHNRLIWSFSFLEYSHISPHISERLYIYIYLLHNSWTVFE